MKNDSDVPVLHPDDVSIEAYCLGRATDAAVNYIEAHISDCSDCARRISDCVRDQMAFKSTSDNPDEE